MEKYSKQALAYLILIILSLNLYSQTSNCLDFDGIDDYVLIGDVNDLGTSDFTIEAWVNLEGSFENKIITKGLTFVGIPESAGYGLRTSFLGPNIVDFSVRGSDGTLTELTFDSITLNNWVHIAGVRSGLNLHLYIDGILVDSEILMEIYNVDTNIPLAIGALDRGNGNNSEFMDGKIDEVRIWNIARTGEEILMSKDCAITSPQANLLAVYNMDSTEGTVVFDNSGNANHGTLVSSPIWVTSEVADQDCSLSTNENNIAAKIGLTPNPFASEIKINNLESETQIRLLTIQGKEIMNKVLGINQSTIDLSFLSSGAYILEIKSDNIYQIKRIIKK